MAILFGSSFAPEEEYRVERIKLNSLLLQEQRSTDCRNATHNFIAFRGFAVGFMETYYKPTKMDFLFDASIPYEAMCLLDQIHLTGKIPRIHGECNTLLFLTTVLLIPWKQKNPEMNISLFLRLSELRLTAAYVEAMELALLRSPNVIAIITPFSFIKNFLSLPQQHSSKLRSVYQLIVKSQADIIFTEFRPSVIAASAMQIFTSNVFPEKEYEVAMSVDKLPMPVEGIINKCVAMLEPLYTGPVNNRPAPRQEEALDADLMNFSLGWIDGLTN